MESLHDLVAAVEHAVAALNAAVTATGFDIDLDDTELHESVIALEKTKSALEIGSCRVLQRWDARHVWLPGGYRSAASRLSREARVSNGAAHRALRRARTLGALPATAQAVTNGSLSIDHLDLFIKANTPARAMIFAEHENTLVEECARLRWSDSVRVIEYWCARADAMVDTGAPQSTPADHVDEHLYASPTINSTVVFNGVLGPVSGEIVLNELDRLERAIYLADRNAGIDRTGSERRAAALVEMARRSATAPANGRRPKPLFTVHVGDETARRLCELAGGAVLRPEQLVDYLDDALLESIVFDGPSTVLAVSQQRSFTGVLRRAIEARDRRCQHPSGCDVAARKCDVDHIVPHSAGGPTSQFNGRLQCPTHNRNHQKHDHRATPAPDRSVHRVDTLRARVRWRLQREWDNEPPGEARPSD